MLDAGVWLAAVNTESPHHPASATLLGSAAAGTTRLTALDLTLYEVANVAVRQWRSERRAVQVADLVRVTSADVLQRVDEEVVRESSMLAAAHGLTVYDAAYVVFGRRLGVPLVSTNVDDLVRPGFAITPEQALDV